jgi:hypothetical protein
MPASVRVLPNASPVKSPPEDDACRPRGRRQWWLEPVDGAGYHPAERPDEEDDVTDADGTPENRTPTVGTPAAAVEGPQTSGSDTDVRSGWTSPGE